MNFPGKPRIADAAWNAWFLRWPTLPMPEKFSLRWTKSRFIDLAASVPSFNALSRPERKAIAKWIDEYTDQFRLDQSPPKRGFDWNGLISTLSGVAGIATLGIAPPIAIGLGVISVLTFTNKEAKQRGEDTVTSLATDVQKVIIRLKRLF